MTASLLAAAPFCQINRIPAGIKNIPWQKAVEISGLAKTLTLDYAAEQSSLRLLHDGTYLYGSIYCQQQDKTDGSRMRDDMMIWQNNTVELFFVNLKGDVRQVIINSEGTVTDLLHLKQSSGPFKTERSWSPVVMLKKEKKAGSWSAEFKIPLKELDFDNNGFCRFNFVRNNFCCKRDAF